MNGRAIGVGVYGERAFAMLKALAKLSWRMKNFVRWRVKNAFGMVYMEDLAMATDGEVVFDVDRPGGFTSCTPHCCPDFSAADCARVRSNFSSRLFSILLERIAADCMAHVPASVAKLRSSEWASREIALGQGCAATVLECLCLIEAIRGEKTYRGLVKAYGEGVASKVVGVPAGLPCGGGCRCR